MADEANYQLLFLQFSGSIFILKIMALAMQYVFKRRALARRRRRDIQRMSAQCRIASYRTFRARLVKRLFNNLTFEFSRPREISRSVWNKPRSNNWWDLIVERTFSDEDWKKNFRMGKSTFSFLCEKLSPFISKEDTHLRQAIPVRKRVGVALWRLATNSDYRTIGHLFGISDASVCHITEEFCSSVVNNMLEDYIKIPVGEELDKVIAEFKHKWGFPQCVGAIDGSHIPVKAPVEFHADYYNRKGWYSIIPQGVVDSSYRFIDINVGWPGKVHDARVFSNSSIFKKGQNGTLFPKEQFADIDGFKVPLFITADAAYPLLPWVMKPFPENGTLGSDKLHFNYRISRARMVVENAFGRLKGRWRCLLKQNEVNIEKMNSIVVTCCVLHNICELFKEEFDTDLYEKESSIQQTGSNDSRSEPSQNANSIRNALIKYCKDVDL